MKKTFLVVEDDPGIEKVIRMVMGHFLSDFCLLWATTVAEAKAHFETSPDIDAILLDGELKGKETSYPFIEYLKEKGYDGPIIAISGNRSEEMCKLGCTEMIPKPFNAMVIVDRLKTT